MKKFSLLPILALLMAGCASVPDSDKAAVESAWDLADQLKNRNGAVLAVVDFEADGIPEKLLLTFREDLSTEMAIAFRETDSDHQVVTRDRVDAVFTERGLVLQGLTADDARMELGRLLGADILVTGTIIRMEGDIYRVSTQLIDTVTGTLLGGVTWEFRFDIVSGN